MKKVSRAPTGATAAGHTRLTFSLTQSRRARNNGAVKAAPALLLPVDFDVHARSVHVVSMIVQIIFMHIEPRTARYALTLAETGRSACARTAAPLCKP